MEKIISVTSILISVFIAYHIFYMSKRLSLKDKISHRKTIKDYVEVLINDVYSNKIKSRVYSVDIDLYEKLYPENDINKGKYSHLKGEIKNATIEGVEIIDGIINVCENGKGKYVKYDGHNKECINTFKVFRVGVIPYEWIEDISLNGDEVNNSALIYCHFKAKTKEKEERKILKQTPFKKYKYYLVNENFNEKTNCPWEIFSMPIKLQKNKKKIFS